MTNILSLYRCSPQNEAEQSALDLFLHIVSCIITEPRTTRQRQWQVPTRYKGSFDSFRANLHRFARETDLDLDINIEIQSGAEGHAFATVTLIQ